MDFEKDYYAILGLESNASPEEVKKTYRVLAKQYHPDINKASNAVEIFNAITEAYEVLSDKRQRAEYDAHLGIKRSRGTRDAPAAGAAGAREEKSKKARRPVPPAVVKLERTLLLSLVVPGLFQIAGREWKFGGLLLTVYIVFWALAIIYNVEIGVLAVLVWAAALLDAYGTFRKKSVEISGQGS